MRGASTFNRTSLAMFAFAVAIACLLAPAAQSDFGVAGIARGVDVPTDSRLAVAAARTTGGQVVTLRFAFVAALAAILARVSGTACPTKEFAEPTVGVRARNLPLRI